MFPNKLPEVDAKLIQDCVLTIIQKYAPEEIELVPQITSRVLLEIENQDKAEDVPEKMFSFSGSADLLSFSAGVITLLLSLVVLPFMKKVYEKALDKTAEKAVDAMALKLHSVLNDLRNKPKDFGSQTRI